MLICSVCGSGKIKKNGFQRGKQRYKCTDCGSQSTPIDSENYTEIVGENVRLAKRAQKFQDKNRIENKSFREYARSENAVIEFVSELRDIVLDNAISFNASELPNYPTYPNGAVGVIHLSDLHFNELVDVIGNTYDFTIASKRLSMYAEKVLTSIKGKELSHMYVVFTGDLLNSDRRLDELLSMATNRAMATFLAVKLLSQFIMHIATQSGIHIKVLSVTGNESRIREEYTQLDSMATDNFDFMIYEMIKLYLTNAEPYVEFLSGNTFEYILNIHDKNILVVHGHRLGKMNHTDLSKAISKWAKKGILINAIMCGHLHEANITDTLLRNGSLVGNNAYSDVGLNLHSHASQNFYIINPDGTIDASKFDLQYVDNYVNMYDISKELDAYNAKSINKIRDKRTIMEILI